MWRTSRWKPDSWRRREHGQGIADRIEPDGRDPVEEALAVRGQEAFDDAPVVGAVASRDQAVALDPIRRSRSPRSN